MFLGRNAYVVQAASRAYFDKDVGELSLAEMAYLAVLPKAPNNYNPFRHHDRAMERRNWVLGQMAKKGYITGWARDAAIAQPLGAIRPYQTRPDERRVGKECERTCSLWTSQNHEKQQLKK